MSLTSYQTAPPRDEIYRNHCLYNLKTIYMPEIILVNGGRGANTILPFLIKKFKITSIVNAYDDGKSTGEIRKYFNILGPSDLRKVHYSMLEKKNKDYIFLKNLFDYRLPVMDNSEIIEELYNFIKKNNKKNIFSLFIKTKYLNFIKKKMTIFLKNLKMIKKFQFSDCSLMNCIYTGAFLKNKKDINLGITEIKKIFSIKNDVMVNSKEERYLAAIRDNGKILYSEAEIVEMRSNIRIKKIFLLKKKLKVNSLNHLSKNKKINFLEKRHTDISIDRNLVKKIEKTKLIIFCPGTQHSSLYPTYMTKGFTDLIIENKNIKKLLIVNIGTDYETPKYKASDYIKNALKYLFINSKYKIHKNNFFDLILLNKPKNKVIPNYVLLDKNNLKEFKSKIIIKDFEDKNATGRHDYKKINKYINLLLNG